MSDPLEEALALSDRMLAAAREGDWTEVGELARRRSRALRAIDPAGCGRADLERLRRDNVLMLELAREAREESRGSLEALRRRRAARGAYAGA